MRDNTDTENRGRVFVHARLEPEVTSLLEKFCKRDGRNRSNAVNYILNDWLLTYEEAEEQA